MVICIYGNNLSDRKSIKLQTQVCKFNQNDLLITLKRSQYAANLKGMVIIMKNQCKVLIGDTSANFGVLCKELLTQDGLNVKIVVKDGNSVLEAIKEFEPDIVVMESFMPKIDAIGIMKECDNISQTKPSFIVVSGYDNKFIETEIMENGASYYMLKPLDVRSLCERIVSIHNHTQTNVKPNQEEFNKNNLEAMVTDVILTLGVPAHVKGYHYIRQSIMLSINDPAMINSITKLLYPTVAKIYATTPSRVERAIRHAIEIAWDRGDVDTLNSYFGYTINVGRGKPTNSEFVAMISDKLRLKIKLSGGLGMN